MRQRYNIKGSDLLVVALANEGVERIFGVPGEENLDVVESLRRSHIQLVLTRHEQSAAFMGATYGRLTGRAGVCISTLGPGAFELGHRCRLCGPWCHADGQGFIGSQVEPLCCLLRRDPKPYV